MKTLFTALAVALFLALAPSAKAGEKNPATESLEPAPTTQFAPQKQTRPRDTEIDPTRFGFVRTNLIATFYHELAHAMIDTMQLPVLAQEEDAADVFSALMIEHLFDSAEAETIIMGALKAGEIDAAQWQHGSRSWDHSDEHGHDLQRYYNLACLYYGADPENRDDFASTANLPTDRAKKCADEYALAARSWGPIIARMANDTPKNIMINFTQSARSNMQIRAAGVLSTEVARMNASYHLPATLRVTVKRCKRNSDFLAYYSSNRRKITICTNYIDDLYRDAPS